MKQTTIKPALLIGQCFHSLDEEKQIQWQGQVIGNPEPGLYLVQLFEWMWGNPSVRRLMKIEDMLDWLFYENAGAMNESYAHGLAREGGPYRKRDTAHRPSKSA
jgi:hypothetical protein